MRAFPYAKKDQEIFFVAEIGANHNQDTKRLEDLIIESKQNGFDAIKLQYYNSNTLWSKEFPEKRNAAMQGEIPIWMIENAKEICNKNQIGIGCSVFDLESVEWIAKHVDFLKIASLECLWFDLIQKCRRTSKPIFVSTGTCSNMEIYNVIKKLWPNLEEDCIFHCQCDYPARIDKLDFPILERIIDSYKGINYNNIGYSDHTVHPSSICSALAIGATVFELHIDFDNLSGNESKHGHCWKLSDAKKVIQDCHEMKMILNNVEKATMIDGYKRFDSENVKLRVDPFDGMRPLKEFRKLPDMTGADDNKEQ